MPGFVVVLRDLAGLIQQTIDVKEIGDLAESVSRLVGEGFTQRHKIEIVSTAPPIGSSSHDTTHSVGDSEQSTGSNEGGSTDL